MSTFVAVCVLDRSNWSTWVVSKSCPADCCFAATNLLASLWIPTDLPTGFNVPAKIIGWKPANADIVVKPTCIFWSVVGNACLPLNASDALPPAWTELPIINDTWYCASNNDVKPTFGFASVVKDACLVDIVIDPTLGCNIWSALTTTSLPVVIIEPVSYTHLTLPTILLV